VGRLGYSESARAATLARFSGASVTSKPDPPGSFSQNKDANVTISLAVVVSSTELLEEKAVRMAPCDNGGQPDGGPVVVGQADDEDEDEEEDEDVDDLDENDEELDEDDLDDDWEEVGDEDEEDDDEEDE